MRLDMSLLKFGKTFPKNKANITPTPNATGEVMECDTASNQPNDRLNWSATNAVSNRKPNAMTKAM